MTEEKKTTAKKTAAKTTAKKAAPAKKATTAKVAEKAPKLEGRSMMLVISPKNNN